MLRYQQVVGLANQALIQPACHTPTW